MVLKAMHESWRIVPELENSEIWELFEGNYRFVYRIKTKDYIEILTVHHTSRDFYTREIL